MSIWSDIEDRSAGITIRKEDEYQDICEFSDPITYVGNIDLSTIPSCPKTGQLYYVQDTVSINGVTFPSGCMILFDGNNWHNISTF